ncbi:IRAK1 (predicted) [Pycnogonum litorale]
MENGSLEDRLLCRDNTTPLRWRQRGRIVKGAARGIQFLHTAGEKPLIHGDIKSANILLDRKMEPKIGDFGLAREGPQGHYTCVEVSSLHGTQYYLPKEYLINRTLSSKVDTYSFGIVLFEIATGLRAFDSKRSKCKELLEYIHDQEDNIETLRDKKAGEEYKEWFVQLIELGKSCTSQMRRRRPEMVVVLQKLELIWDEEESKERGRKISREGKSLPDNAPMSPILVQAFYDEEKKKLNTLNVHEMNPVGESGKRSPVSPGLRSLNAPNLPEITENSREHRFRDEYSFKSPPSSHYLPPSSQSGMLYDDTSFESNISNCSDSKLGDYNSPPNYSTVTADDQAAGQSPAQIPLLTELGIKMSPKGVEFDDESSRSSEHLPADMRHLKITDDNVF